MNQYLTRHLFDTTLIIGFAYALVLTGISVSGVVGLSSQDRTDELLFYVCIGIGLLGIYAAMVSSRTMYCRCSVGDGKLHLIRMFIFIPWQEVIDLTSGGTISVSLVKDYKVYPGQIVVSRKHEQIFQTLARFLLGGRITGTAWTMHTCVHISFPSKESRTFLLPDYRELRNHVAIRDLLLKTRLHGCTFASDENLEAFVKFVPNKFGTPMSVSFLVFMLFILPLSLFLFVRSYPI